MATREQSAAQHTDNPGGQVSMSGRGVGGNGGSDAEGRAYCVPARAHRRTAAQPHSRTAAQPHSRTTAQEHATWEADYCTRDRDVQEQVQETGQGRRAVPEQEGQEGRGPRRREPCPVRQSDLEDLRGHLGQTRWRSGYRALIGGDQPRLAAGDITGASAMLHRIEEAVERGGWSANERTRLYRMLAKWRARASGQDARFLLAGNRPGRLYGPAAEQLHELRQTLTAARRET